MGAGILILGSRDVQIHGSTLGGEHSVEVYDSSDIVIEGSTLKAPVKGRRVRGFTAMNNLYYPDLSAYELGCWRLPPVWRRFELPPHIYKNIYGVAG